ncbi:HEPN domain-containing protein [Sorangium sp. So ce513]|uniref:HEPN domain-containing protein n=1 Tax=Sorangium sp. So ce513 TaxID=3133315 RepID=UPI003F6051FB
MAQASSLVIRRLQPSEALEEVRVELTFTQRRLDNDPRTKNLVGRLLPLLARIDGLQSPVGTPASSKIDAATFITDVNRVRCQILGELTALACEHQLNMSWPRNFFRQQTKEPERELERGAVPSGPSSIEDWVEVANERAEDARAMLASNRPVGAVYMAGYAIECSLKALLKSKRKPFPTSGREGHNLRALWQAAGFLLTDLRDRDGARSFFVEHWCTDLRYESTVDSPLAATDLLRGAQVLTSWIQTQIKRSRRPR